MDAEAAGGGVVSGVSWFILGAYATIGTTELSRWWHGRRAGKVVPAAEHLRVPLGFTAELRERSEGKATKYVQLEGRWLVPVDDLTRIMTIEAERLEGLDARAEAYTCRQVAEWFSTDVLEIELRQMGGES